MSFPYTFPFSFEDEVTPPPPSLPFQDGEAVALSRFRQFLQGQPNAAALVAALVQSHLELEATLQETLFYRQLENSFGATENDLGVLVGEARAGLPDAEYLLYLKAAIRANLSNGTTEDLYAVLALIMPVGVTQALTWWAPIPDDGPPAPQAAFVIRLTGAVDVPTATAMQTFIAAARGGGIYGVLEYSQGTPAGTFQLDGGAGTGFDSGVFSTAVVS